MDEAIRRGVVMVAMLLLAGEAWPLDVQDALDKLGFPSGTKESVLGGAFVKTSLPPTSDRDLSVGIAFLVKVSPAEFLRRMEDETLMEEADSDMVAFGGVEGESAFSTLELTPSEQKAFENAGPGEDVNVSPDEIAALAAEGATLQAKVRQLLRNRYETYRARGLAGISPYARKGSSRDAAADLRLMNGAACATGLLPAEACQLLDGYPEGKPPDLQESFYWARILSHGDDTIVLAHDFHGTFGGAIVAVQRQFYASAGYNVEQAVAGFFPVEQGTLVLYQDHTSTDQVGGTGGEMKRDIGRKILAGELENTFEKLRSGPAD